MRQLCWKSHARAPIRLLSIRAPRQTVLRTSSRLAPFVHPETLRFPGVKDARCVRPISATQTNCVYPHRVCFRFALAAYAAGTPHGVLGSVRHDRRLPDVSRRPETASADRHRARNPHDAGLTAFIMSVGLFGPRR